MNCPNCGREARGSFCTGCGTRLAGNEGASQPGLGTRPFGDPDATSIINHQELRAFLAQAEQDQSAAAQTAITPPREESTPATPVSSGWEPSPPPTEAAAAPSGWDTVPTTGYSAPAADVFSQPVSGSTAVAPISTAISAPFAPVADFPVEVTFDVAPTNKRFFAIPVVGYVARAVMLIPHIIALYLVMIGVMASQLVLWIPVLFKGTYPGWGYGLVSGTMRWATSVFAYFYGLTDQYPAFGFADRGIEYPVHVNIPYPTNPNRLFAIPVVGYLIRLVLLIPHLVVLYVLGLVAGLIAWVAWIPVLTSGRYPDWGYSMVGGYLRWTVRAGSYALGLTDQYPPFRLGN